MELQLFSHLHTQPYSQSNQLNNHLNGSVKRGVCHEKDGYLTDLIESKVEYEGEKIVATPLNGNPSFDITPDTLVSMNMLGFNTSIFSYIEDNFVKFLSDNKDNILKCEYLIPDTVFDAMDNGFCRVKLLGTSARWQGITYKEDKHLVVDEINSLISFGVYPSKLWD